MESAGGWAEFERTPRHSLKLHRNILGCLDSDCCDFIVSINSVFVATLPNIFRLGILKN